MNKLPGIDFKNDKSITLDSELSLFEIPFYKDSEYLAIGENFVSFIKQVEKMVRTSKRYSKYIRYLKEAVGLTYCQVLSNINDEMADIEMHHGPILTLYDIVSIVTDHLIYKNKPVNTFIVADIVLKEHFENNCQVVMLSSTVHQSVDNLFISHKQAFGDINKFLNRYKYGLTKQQIEKIDDYIKVCKSKDSTDNNIFSLEKIIKKI